MQMLDRHIWRSMISVSTKLRLCNVYILPVFLYGAETWSITKAIEKRIDAFDYLVGVCNEFRSPSAYWPATAVRYCADQTPEVVWPRGPGRQVSRSFPCSTSLHIACPKELVAASRSSKTYLAKDGGGRYTPI